MVFLAYGGPGPGAEAMREAADKAANIKNFELYLITVNFDSRKEMTWGFVLPSRFSHLSQRPYTANTANAPLCC
jgi:hypothetical protein